MNRVGHWPGEFDAPNHIAIHPIGTRKVKVFYVPSAEVKHPRVLQKTPDDGAHPDIVRLTRYLGGQHTGAPDDQIYLDALTHAYDPHSDYLGKSAYATFNMQMKLSLFGIGALLQDDDGYCKIAELTPGGPAIKSGLLKAGDRIVKVQQENKEAVDVVGVGVEEPLRAVKMRRR